MSVNVVINRHVYNTCMGQLDCLLCVAAEEFHSPSAFLADVFHPYLQTWNGRNRSFCMFHILNVISKQCCVLEILQNIFCINHRYQGCIRRRDDDNWCSRDSLWRTSGRSWLWYWGDGSRAWYNCFSRLTSFRYRLQRHAMICSSCVDFESLSFCKFLPQFTFSLKNEITTLNDKFPNGNTHLLSP